MASINVSGLINGSFDWQSVVNQLIQVDSAPITKLQAEEATNNKKIDSLTRLQSTLTDLQTAAQSLSDSTLFLQRSATVADSTWKATAAAGTAAGTYSVAIQNLATASRLTGTGDLAAGLAASSDVSGLTLASLPTALAPTAGTFSVDGHQVTIALTDSLQDVFDKISAATSGVVTGTYDPATDRVTLASTDASEVVLGASNDTSNFLQALRLGNNGTRTVSSAGALGTVAVNAPLAGARLKSAITAVDVDGNGSFTVNGVTVAYNVNTDSLSTVLARINASAAGVTARYDSAADRVILTNAATGDLGMGVSEATGGLLGALGLATGATLAHGQNALYSVNGGATLSSASNTLDGADFGASGLSVLAGSATTQTVTVAANTDAMTSAIKGFINQYNAVQDYISSQTSIAIDSSGSVQASLLSNNREIQNWAQQLRSTAFAQVAGLSGTVKRLADLGIDFSSTGSDLSIKDSAKLADALQNHGADVAAFFNTASTGFASKFTTYVDSLLGATGPFFTQTDTLNRQNASIDKQITFLQSQIDRERAMLTASFEAMQTAQSNANAQSQLLTNLVNSLNSANGTKNNG